MKNPILAQTVAKLDGHCVKQEVTVLGGLNYLTGNSLPYFSLTFEQRNKGRERVHSCGADHEHILKLFPQFADLAALHLSDIDGAPVHALDNGFYWLAGAVEGHFGKKYHGGNHSQIRDYDRAKCLEIVADHFRISIEDATKLADTIKTKAHLALWVELQRPRWKVEAEACIAKHGLVVYGAEYDAAA